jgi:hypothetical protein
LLTGLSGRIHGVHNAQLFAFWANHANFPRADALIHLNKPFIYAILLKYVSAP